MHISVISISVVTIVNLYIMTATVVIALIAIANPNSEVHLSLSKSGLIDLIGKQWCFVRVHDAVQVCLQHVQNPNRAPTKSEEKPPSRHRSLLQNLWKHDAEDFDHSLQPLLPQKEV